MEEFQGQTVGHYTDSKSVAFILSGGFRNTRLQKLSIDLFLKLRKFKITLIPIWISRDSEIIARADLGSRNFRFYDCSLDPVILNELKSHVDSWILVIPVCSGSQIFHFFFPDGIHAADWVETLVFINPSFVSSQAVGECFKIINSLKQWI